MKGAIQDLVTRICGYSAESDYEIIKIEKSWNDEEQRDEVNIVVISTLEKSEATE